MAHPPHSLDRVHMYSTVIFHDTMQLASKDSTAVTTVRTYVHVCGHLAYVGTVYNSEDTCKTMLLHVRVLLDDHYVQYHSKIYAYVHTCTEVVCIEWQTIRHTRKACRTGQGWQRT